MRKSQQNLLAFFIENSKVKLKFHLINNLHIAVLYTECDVVFVKSELLPGWHL